MKKGSLGKSFVYAFSGILTVIKEERNMKIHLAAALMVSAAGALLHISRTEWLICLVLFALVMSLEIVNTAVESVVDLVTDQEHPLAGRAKDAAAGAVLLSACAAAVIGLIIFVPKILSLM
jgi:diacylglycerol kinase (ATP)